MDSYRLARALQADGQATSDFDLNPQVTLPPHRKLTPAAVLVLVDEIRGTVLLTKRASHLKNHPGQISFPGGKRDADDASLDATALREAHEEIGMPAGAAEILGPLNSHETVTGYTVTPIVALQVDRFELQPEAGEVAEVFHVPLNFLLDPENFRVERRRWRGEWRHFYVVPWGPYYIWGATARILRGLAERVLQCD